MVFDKLCELLADQLGIDPADISPKTHIIRDLGADSLDVVEMVTTLEDAFNIVFLDEEVRERLTVGEIVAYIESKL